MTPGILIRVYSTGLDYPPPPPTYPQRHIQPDATASRRRAYRYRVLFWFVTVDIVWWFIISGSTYADHSPVTYNDYPTIAAALLSDTGCAAFQLLPMDSLPCCSHDACLPTTPTLPIRITCLTVCRAFLTTATAAGLQPLYDCWRTFWTIP